MKKILYLFVFVFTLSNVSLAQDDGEDGAEKLRDKMIEYIQNKLSLTKAEAEKFQPIFLDYLKQVRSTKQQYKGDRILLQQKIAELRLRTREQFKPVLGETRSNEVFKHEHDFVDKVRKEIIDRKENRLESRANKKSGLLQ
jgi:hypothetical protein